MDKIVHVTKTIWIRVKYSAQTRRLTITGVDRPRRNGDADSCGQIYDALASAPKDQLLVHQSVRDEIVEVWKRWHLNDLNAGTQHQMQVLRDNGLAHSRYEDQKAFLTAMGIEAGFGHAWHFEEVPQPILDAIALWPEAEVKPAWI